MELTINRKTLLDVIGRARGVTGHNTVPILGHVLIDAKDKGVTVTATDLEVGIQTALPDEHRWKIGTIAVNAHKLHEILKATNAEEISLRSLDGDWIEINAGRAKFKMTTLDPRSFPALPSQEKRKDGNKSTAGKLIITAKSLAEMIDRTLFAVSPDEARYNLSGVYIESIEGGVRMVATDRHRLALIEREAAGFRLEQDGKPKGAIIPRKGVEVMRKLIDGIDGTVDLTIDGQLAFVKIGDTVLSVRLVEGEFPDYAGVMPKESKIKLLGKRDELIGAVKRAMIFTNERLYRVKFEIIEDAINALRVSSANVDTGEASEDIEIAGGQPVRIGFNGSYVQQMLNVLPAESSFTLALSDEVSAGVFTSETDLGYTYVVMPMRL